MKKRFFAALTALLLCLLLCISAFADRLFVVRDGAELLTVEEETTLDDLAWQVCDEQNFQIVIVTVNSLGGQDIVSYADDLYDNSGYLEDGALFILDMYSREWYVSTAGRGQYALSDAKIDEIAADVVAYLSAEDYYEGFRLFIKECGEAVESYDNGSYVPSDSDYYVYNDEGEIEKSHGVSPFWIPGSFGIGALVALFATGNMKSQMNNVRSQTNATGYTKKGSLNLTESQDVFLYNTVSRVPRPKDDDRSSHGGGSFGGGIHMSGGGVSHGGHGGHF